ncbi:unnamed protein product [Arctogadus glacialis]
MSVYKLSNGHGNAPVCYHLVLTQCCLVQQEVTVRVNATSLYLLEVLSPLLAFPTPPEPAVPVELTPHLSSPSPPLPGRPSQQHRAACSRAPSAAAGPPSSQTAERSVRLVGYSPDRINVVGPHCTSHCTSSPAQKNPASASMELQKVSNGHEYETLDKGIQPEEEAFLPEKSDGFKKQQFTDFEGKMSFGMSAFNLSNAIMGSGILGLSYAMSNTGIVLFPILLTAIALLSSYSVHLLLQCAGVVGIRAYEQLGLRAFGQVGKIIAAVIITLHNIGAMSSYLFIVKFELPLVIQAFLGQTSSSEEWYMNGNYLIVIVSVLIILPLALMKHLGYLGYTSGFSLTCMVFFLSSVIYKRFNIPCPLEAFGNFSANATIPEDTCTAKLFTVNREVRSHPSPIPTNPHKLSPLRVPGGLSTMQW